MKIHLIMAIPLVALLFQSCANQNNEFHDRCIFGEQEVGYWRKSAMEAATSGDAWARVGTRITKRPLRLDLSHLEYNLDCPDHQVDVIIDNGQPAGETQPTFVRIRLDRETALVKWMREEFY